MKSKKSIKKSHKPPSKFPLMGIIGAEGKMGKAFTELFEQRGLSVLGSDLGTSLTNEEVARQADILIFSVPISVTPALIKNLAPKIKKGSLVTDLTSIKTPAITAMKRFVPESCEIVGLHPLFNSTMISDMRKQVFAVCEVRSGKLTSWLFRFLRKEGALLKFTSSEEHDKMMSIIQGLTHLSSIATAMALKRLGFNIEESFEFSSPVYRLRLEMVGRILSQSPRLYAEIALENPLTKVSFKAYQDAIETLSKRIKHQDLQGFMEDFRDAADFLGDFKDDAYQRTTELIQRSRDIL